MVRLWLFSQARLGPGPRQRGVASARGGVSPTLEVELQAERKGRSAAEVCTSEARKIGETPCARKRGRAPLVALAVAVACKGAKRRFGQEQARRGGSGNLAADFAARLQRGAGAPLNDLFFIGVGGFSSLKSL